MEDEIRRTLPELGGAEFAWCSPCRDDKVREYSDAAFLRRLGYDHLVPRLKEFWPTGGPHWDALAVVTRNGKPAGPLLVEAKSYPGEMGSRCTATSDASRNQIAERLAETRRWLGVDESHASAWIDELYQSANRFAHLYFFRSIAKQDAWLVNLYFMEDPDRATTREEWEAALADAEQRLGLLGKAVPHSSRVFLKGQEPVELV